MSKYQWQSASRVKPIYQQFRDLLADHSNAISKGDADAALVAENKIFNIYSILDPNGNLRDEILLEMSKEPETTMKWVYRKRVKKAADSEEDYFS